MKYNTTYKQLISLKETIKWIEFFKNKINSHYDEIFNFTEVIPPLLAEDESDMEVDFSAITRGVTIDLGESYQVARFYQTHSNWARELINRLNMQEEEGIKFLASTVWRDEQETPTSTIVKQEMTFQVKVDSKLDFRNYLRRITKDLYDFLLTLLVEIKDETKIDHQYPKTIKFITAQQLETELADLNFKERELETLIEEEAYVLVNAGKLLHSGKIHSPIPPQVYDMNNYYQLILRDRINTDVIKVASVALLSSGEDLSEQLSFYDMASSKALPFYRDLINREDKLIEIKINLPLLAMALLAKGHIAETQAGVISEESNIIKQRYKLEKF